MAKLSIWAGVRIHGFTLVEMLVVIAICALLMAIIFPVFNHVREKGRQTTCLSNQRQIVMAIMMAAQDSREQMPEAATVWQSLGLTPKIYRDPSASDMENGYVYNNKVAGRRLAALRRLSSTVVTADGWHVADAEPGTYDNVAYSTDDLQLRHNDMIVVSYADGHVKALKMLPEL